jgi:hypothetical protein
MSRIEPSMSRIELSMSRIELSMSRIELSMSRIELSKASIDLSLPCGVSGLRCAAAFSAASFHSRTGARPASSLNVHVHAPRSAPRTPSRSAVLSLPYLPVLIHRPGNWRVQAGRDTSYRAWIDGVLEAADRRRVPKNAKLQWEACGHDECGSSG